MDFLMYKLLPSNCSGEIKTKKDSSTFFVEEPLRNLEGDTVTRILREVHSEVFDGHQGCSSLLSN